MLNKKVKEIMTGDVKTITSDMDVVYAFEKLMKYKISSLPVVDDNKLIGIITATDVGHNLILDKYELGTSVGEIMVKDVVTISLGGLLITDFENFSFEKQMSIVDKYLYIAKSAGKDISCYNGNLLKHGKVH